MKDPKMDGKKSRYVNGVNIYNIRARMRDFLEDDFIDFRDMNVELEDGKIERRFVLMCFNIENNINDIQVFQKMISPNKIWCFQPVPMLINEDGTIRPFLNKSLKRIFNIK